MQVVASRRFEFVAVLFLGFSMLLLIIGHNSTAFGQTAVSGGLAGTVVDSTGAVVPNATVTLTETATGDTRVLTTNEAGRYIAPYLKPGRFNVSASLSGMQSVTMSVDVFVGQQSTGNLTVSPTASRQTVTVDANNAQLIDTQSSNLTTTFTTAQFQSLPAPGGDITSIAYTVPGVVMNTNAGFGFGNFSSNGLPGLSNLLVINGADYNDPFDGLNASGASEMTIGQQEISQASVVQNGYSVQYGRQAGAQEIYSTKSGSNRVHGLAMWTYNSDGLNANDFFSNLYGVPRRKAVSNQYAAQIGGPILHNKLFFFADTEGLRVLFPVSGYVNFPTPALQNTILNTVSPASASLYKTMFNLLETAPSYRTAAPVTNGSGGLQDSTGKLGCGSAAGIPVYGQPNTYLGTAPAGGVAVPCIASAFTNAGSNINREWFVSGRMDWNVNDKQKIFLRLVDDQGTLPTVTSLINPLLNNVVPSPLYSGQLNHTYVFSPNLTNQFVASGFYYSDYDVPVTTVQNLLNISPTSFSESFDGGSNASIGLGVGFDWSQIPNGREVTQYQFVDGLSWLKGNHNLKFGADTLFFNVIDSIMRSGTYAGSYTFNSLADLVGGNLPGKSNSYFFQTFSTLPSVRAVYNNLGFYAQDEWQATRNLKLDYGIRVDRTSNPRCTNANCFSRFNNGIFPAASATLDTPYNSTLSVGYKDAYQSIEAAEIQPRAGFIWDTTGEGKTVVRGGIGVFADEFNAYLVESDYYNFPNIFFSQVQSGLVALGANSAPATATASFNAFNTGFSQGKTYNQLKAELAAQGVPFSPPAINLTPRHFLNPRYLEWNMQVQQQISPTDALILSYAGNHGYNLIEANNHLNQSIAGTSYKSFSDLPTVTPDPRFSVANTYLNDANSNYNGLSLTYKHIDRHGLTANLSYTWSHSMDDISNGGSQLPFGSNSINQQILPTSPSALNYSNSDYDIRNNFVMDITYVVPYHFQNKIVNAVGSGWTVAGKAYWRTGTPFSVFNTSVANALNNNTGQTQTLAEVLNNNFNHTCSGFGHDLNSLNHACLQTPGIFLGTTRQMNFGNVPRNSFFGPHYADVDLSLYKNIIQAKALQFQVGAQTYNAFNHANFATPGDNASQPQSLGRVCCLVTAPTSPFGAFATPARVVVVTGKLTF